MHAARLYNLTHVLISTKHPPPRNTCYRKAAAAAAANVPLWHAIP
jgi:hypothetical protein